MELRPGTITVLMGPNGAGKTHRLEQLAGLRAPDGARIRFGKEPLWLPGKKKAPRLNRQALLQYAYAAQSPEEQLFARTAEEELRAALAPYSLTAQAQDERIGSSLEAVGWDDSWRVRGPFRMSGGEKRRLALACLLAAPARWLLMDEPTAGLDAAGQHLVAERMREKRAEGCGILIVSHDSEWALQLADRVWLLTAAGELRELEREELLARPDYWEEAGLPLPAWLSAAGSLIRGGLPPELALDPVAAAAEWARREQAAAGSEAPDVPGAALSDAGARLALAGRISLASRAAAEPRAAFSRDVPCGALDAAEPLAAASLGEAGMRRGSGGDGRAVKRDERTSRSPSRRAGTGPLASLDPRAVWLSYVMLSLAIFALREWSGVAAAGAVVAAALALGRISLRRWRAAIFGFALFTLLVSALAGIGWNGTFRIDAFWMSLHSMARTFLVMLLGLGLAMAITPLRLKRSLELLLSVRGTLPVLAQKIVLTLTLIVRFIPVLLSEWQRFARFAIARDKETGRSAGSAIRRIRGTAMPLLLGLFRMGEQVAFALESRGVGSRKTPALARTERWRKRDSALVLVSAAIAGALWLLFS
nr:ATP-binding cassette domain-containing protein [Cohnella zeiphila]